MRKKIKILYIIDCLGPGGKERQLVELLKNIDRNKFRTGVVTFNKNQFYTKIIKENVDYFKEISKKFILSPCYSIWRSFTDFIPDIVHTVDSLSSFYAYYPSKYHRVKFINGSIQDTGIEKSWEYKFKKYYLEKADFRLSNSLLGLKVYGVKGDVLYNAIDESRFIPLNKTTNEFNIINTSNFTIYKDHETFIKAALMLIEKNIVDNVYLAGDGDLKLKYEIHLNEYDTIIKNRFHFLGTISNVEEYLSECKVGVLCSTKEYGEGIPNSILEYMASGLIAIATNVGAVNEIISDGINGFLVEEKNAYSIFDIISKIKNNVIISKNIIEKAQKTINEKFNHKLIISRLSLYYENIVNAN